MPTIRVSTIQIGPVLPVSSPTGPIHVPRVQFRCLVRLPQLLMPQDGVVDTGAPLSCFPKSVWDRFVEGTDYEWLPFDPAFQPPVGQMVGWRYTFRLARFLVPLTLMDMTTAVDRVDVVAQFADNDPPARRGQALPLFIVGLWGGLLEGGRIGVERDPASGQVTGDVAFP